MWELHKKRDDSGLPACIEGLLVGSDVVRLDHSAYGPPSNLGINTLLAVSMSSHGSFADFGPCFVVIVHAGIPGWAAIQIGPAHLVHDDDNAFGLLKFFLLHFPLDISPPQAVVAIGRFEMYWSSSLPVSRQEGVHDPQWSL